MIRPDTAPGTEVVCIDDSPGKYGNSGLHMGEIYVVDKICEAISGNHVVFLSDVPPWEGYAAPWGIVYIGFELRRFRYLDIPSSLTGLLTDVVREHELEDA